MRRFTRHPTDIPIDIRIINQPLDSGTDHANMTSVSVGGISCEVSEAVDVGALVEITIASVTPPYHGSGEVVWCEGAIGRYRIGVSFKDQREAFKSRMVQQVCQIEHYKNVVYEREGRIIDGNQAAREWIEKHAARYP